MAFEGSAAMASPEESLSDVRDELLRLLRANDWQLTESARKTSVPILRATGCLPTDAAVIEFIIGLLETNFPFHQIEMVSGEPGYVMNNADGRGLYIKLKIERGRTDEVWLLSFHLSQHYKG